MAPKRPSPLDDPPAATSSEEEEVSSEGEEESGSGSGAESDDPEPSNPAPTPALSDKKVPLKKPESSATANSKPQSSSSGSESGSDSESESDSDGVIKPIASKPMEVTPTKTKKPVSKPAATATPAPRAGSKRASETSEAKDSKKPKKKSSDSEETAKKSGGGGDDGKKLFQRIWCDEDEIVILKGMVDYKEKQGSDPHSDMAGFHDFIKKSLKADVNKTQLQDKIRRMKKKLETSVAKGDKYNPGKPHEVKVFELSKNVWGGEGNEQSKSNGKAGKSRKKSDKVTLAALKGDHLSSPERLKDVVKVVESEGMKLKKMKACGGSSESLSEDIGFDKGFQDLGLSESVMKQGMELIGGAKRAELKERWREQHVAEVELFVRRSELMTDQAKVILEAFKSSDD